MELPLPNGQNPGIGEKIGVRQYNCVTVHENDNLNSIINFT